MVKSGSYMFEFNVSKDMEKITMIKRRDINEQEGGVPTLK